MKLNFFLISILIAIVSFEANAQVLREKWEKVDGVQGDELFVNVNGIRKVKDSDIVAWTLQNHTVPLVIESVTSKIYKTKTSYLFNYKLKKYSLMEVIYYDSNNRVIQSFNYRNNSARQQLKYNFPVIPGSEMELILNKCMDTINQ